MAGKQVPGDGLSASLAGMSKNQLYDIMSQMKQLIEQNQQQARQILIQNPVLTRALFQAQIMLGMVQPPQAIPNIQAAASQNPQPSKSPIQPSNIQTASPSPGQTIKQEQIIKQEQNPLATTVSSASVLPSNLQPPSFPSHPLQSTQQPKGHIASQPSQMPIRQSSQLPNMPHLPHHAASQPPNLQAPISSVANQLQQPMQTTSMPHLPPLQPPLPTQPRPPMPTFSHQGHSQMGLNVGFQHSSAPQLHHSQPVYHSGTRPPAGPGSSFLQGQPPHPIQAPLQPPYQVGGSQIGTDYNTQIVSSNQADRGSPWVPGIKQESASGAQLPGPPQFPGQMGPGNQPTRPALLTPEMENALLQQVMSLTPEQINQLPPEQRNQVLQLQQMLRP